MNISVIILAAGKSSRMKSSLPKILHKIAALPMINYVINNAKSIKAKEIITVVSGNSEQLQQHIFTLDKNIKFAIQEKQCGTADAVRCGLKISADSDITLILYADTPLITTETIQNLIGHLKKDSSLCLLGFRAGTDNEYGRLITKDDQLLKIVEYKEASKQQKMIDLCNSGVIAIKTKLLNQLIGQINNNNSKGEYYFTDIIALAVEDGHKASFIEADEDEVLGINNRAELAMAEAVMQSILCENFLHNGVTIIDPNSVYFAYDTKIEPDVTIHPFVTMGPDVIIETGTEIKSFSHIEGAHIKNNSIIGPYARIRPGTVINRGAHIGNFVEIKNSDIGQSAKINHLSYIGDAKVGDGSNIGAGTITCNYDGFNKHTTQIGSHVFVGSNSTLIAPITIEDDVYVAAGSVINKNVPKNALAIARANMDIKLNMASEIRKRKSKSK
jgi:bifunctional UDP-N-acetylglucosamine pyrophosphorylase/glucosamine-1-phosphate N-acetyltransferase